MDDSNTTLADAGVPQTVPPPLAVNRRSVLGIAVSAPVITTTAGLALAPALVEAAPLPLTPPDSVDYEDVGDVIFQAAAPTVPLTQLTYAGGIYTLDMPRCEQGTGIATALAQMIAEEAGVPLSQVRVTSADATRTMVANQITGGSCSVRIFEPFIKQLVAKARANAGLPPQIGASSDPAQWKVQGKRMGKLDALDIVTGRKKFTMDLNVPGAVPTMMRMPSQIRGTVVSVNNRAAVEAMPGVVAVVVIPPGGDLTPRQVGVAVMAQTFGEAYDACRALDITWGNGPLAGATTASIFDLCRAAIPPLLPAPVGTIALDAEFTWKPASAAPLEVECAIVDATQPDRAEVWSGLQCPIAANGATAKDLGFLDQSQVTTHVVPPGGAFGRRLFWDAVQCASYISKATGRVCKLMYHRSDDLKHTRFRPPQVHKVRMTINPTSLLAPGNVLSFQQGVGIVRNDTRHGFGDYESAQSVSNPMSSNNPPGVLASEYGYFKTMVASPYNFGANSKQVWPIDLDMNTVSYRSVHIQPARTVEEIMVDEAAKALGKDPVAFRLEFLRKDRAKAVLQRCAGAAQWGKAMPLGFAQGVGVHMESRSFTACIVELDCRDPDNCKVTRATIVIDVGKPINPSGIEQQMNGGLAEAISLVLQTGINIEAGLPREGSYNHYRFCKQKDFPKDVQVIVMPNVGDPIGGIGEVGMSAPSGAIANAYARATGRKPRNFPLNAQPVFTPVAPGQLPPPAVAAA